MLAGAAAPGKSGGRAEVIRSEPVQSIDAGAPIADKLAVSTSIESDNKLIDPVLDMGAGQERFPFARDIDPMFEDLVGRGWIQYR